MILKDMSLLNTDTGRSIKLDGPTHRRLLKLGYTQQNGSLFPPTRHSLPVENNISNVLKYVLLPRLNIILLRRLMSLNHELHRAAREEQFWRAHVINKIPIRHSDHIIEKITIGNNQPWRSYAILFSQRRMSSVYYAGSIVKREVHWSPILFKNSHYDQFVSSDINIVTIDHNILEWDRVELKKEKVAKLSLSFNSILSFNLDHTITHIDYNQYIKPNNFAVTQTKVQPTNDHVIDGKKFDQIVALLTDNGEIVIVNNTFTSSHRMIIKVPALKVVLIRDYRTNDKRYIMYLIGIDGSLWEYQMLFNDIDQLVSVDKEQIHNISEKIIDIKVDLDVIWGSSILVLTEKGYCYGFGYSRQHALGLTNKYRVLTEFTKLMLTDIIAIDLVNSHSVFLDNEGEVWTSGETNGGVLGLGRLHNSKGVGPKKVELPVGRNAVGVVISDNATFFLLE